LELSLAVLADAANVSLEGKLNILGEFSVIWGPTLPLVWPAMQLVLRLEATAGEGPRHTLGIRVLTEDGQLVVPPVDVPADFGAPFRAGLPHRGNFIMGIAGAAFPRFGAYSFEILVDGHNVGSVPLYVLPIQERPPTRP